MNEENTHQYCVDLGTLDSTKQVNEHLARYLCQVGRHNSDPTPLVLRETSTMIDNRGYRYRREIWSNPSWVVFVQRWTQAYLVEQGVESTSIDDSRVWEQDYQFGLQEV